MTGWIEIICDYAMLYIDDDRMTEKLKNNPARFFREMSLYMRSAIPRFNRPVEIVAYLKQGTQPSFNSFLWTAPAPEEEPGEDQEPKPKAEGPELPLPPPDEPTEEPEKPTPPEGMTAVETGMVGYELCSVVLRGTDRYGNTTETPYPQAEYNAETGEVYMPEGIEPGTVFDMDFYTDGTFTNDLTQEMKRILGLCVQSVWEQRFTSAWLPREAKVIDRSFTAPNEANWTRAQEEKRRSLEATLNEELRNYEQNCAYMTTVGGRRGAFL